MPLALQVLILILELGAVGLLMIALHRLSPRFGLGPMVLLIGALTALLQYRFLGVLVKDPAGIIPNLPVGSYVILPVLLLGLLIIYVIEGTAPARNILGGMILVSILTAIFQVIVPLYMAQPDALNVSVAVSIPSPRIPLASALTLFTEMVVLVVVYQATSNLRDRFPSRLAGGLAILVALWIDALLFPTLAYLGTDAWPVQLIPNLVGKSLAGLVLWPLSSLYLYNTAWTFPDSAAAVQRPVLDLFTTRRQLEARARYHYSLLRTVTQINQATARADNDRDLLQRACQLLADGCDYSLVWIGLVDNRHSVLRPMAKAGPKAQMLETLNTSGEGSPLANELENFPLETGQAVIHNDLEKMVDEPAWREAALAAGLHACAIFPMRFDSQVLGVLNVFAHHPNAFAQADEIDLLGQLADDLAHAITNLKTRSEQALLHTATETMRDGLLITTAIGRIVYANPVIARMVGYQVSEMIGRNILSFVTREQALEVILQSSQSLHQEGQFTVETPISNRQGEEFYASVQSILVHLGSGKGTNIVVNVRDATNHRLYEYRLLTINRLATELVQIYDPQEVFPIIHHVCEDLLQATASGIYLVSADGEQIAEAHAHNMPEDYVSRIQRDIRQLPGREVLEDAQIHCVEDINDRPIPPEQLAALHAGNINALMSLPILYQEQTLGVLCLYYQAKRPFSETDKQLALTVAHSLAIALQNARLYQAEYEQRQLAEALAQATGVLSTTLDLEIVLDQILEQTIRVVPCRSVNLMLIAGDHARVVRQLHRSSEDRISRYDSGPTLPLSTPTLHQILVSEQPLLIPDTIQDPLWRKMGTTTWVRSYAAAPLQIRQQVIGFLNVNSDQQNFFTEETKHHLQAFASNAAAAIHNARLYQDLQKHTLELEDRVRSRTAELSSAKDRIEVILASVPDAVFVLDEDDQLLEANQAGEALNALAEQVNIDLFDTNLMARVKNGAVPDEKGILEVQGRAYQALASPLPIQDQQIGSVIVFRDVTRFHELDQMKTQFVSDVSHELRTPLTNLSLYLDLLSQESDENRRSRFQATLRRETQRLSYLIEDLLTISRLEADRLSIEMRAIDVASLADELATDRMPMAEERGLDLECDTASDLPPALADPKLLTQVLSNLLTNALNYTPSGTIKLHTAVKQDSRGHWVLVSIHDSGIGIPPKDLGLIFERFYRGSAVREMEAPGTGLGLAISREIMERMGGKITVESTPGEGSTFTVWLKAML